MMRSFEQYEQLPVCNVVKILKNKPRNPNPSVRTGQC